MKDIIDAVIPVAGVLTIFSVGAFALEYVGKMFGGPVTAPVTGPIPVPVTPPSPQPGTDNPPTIPTGNGDEFTDISDEWLFGPLLSA